MKTVVVFLLSVLVAEAKALPTQFPEWLTDDKAKVWTVEALTKFMENDEFYKIRDIQVSRFYDETNKCDALDVKLTFDDPKCKGRTASISALAALCEESGCGMWQYLTGCKTEEALIRNQRFFMKR